MQSAGNLVEYLQEAKAGKDVALWSTPTAGDCGGTPHATMDDNGDLVLVCVTEPNGIPHSTVYWSSNSTRSVSNAELVVQTDGNLVVYSGSKALWASTTKANGSAIANLALDNLAEGYDSLNSIGGKGFYTSTTGENWCADFAHWVWNYTVSDGAGVQYTSSLTPGVVSFYDYGVAHNTWFTSHPPVVGDAVVFDGGSGDDFAHIAIVTQVNSNGTIESTGGNEGNNDTELSTVNTDGPYSWEIGTTLPNSSNSRFVEGYVTPVYG